MTTSIHRSLLAALVVFVLAAIGCSGEPREKLARKVFDALRRKSVSAFMSTTITAADFELRAQGISIFEESQSYLGGVVKPEEKKHQRNQFRIARRGGPEYIDFSEDHFVGLGRCVEQETRETVLGTPIPVWVYSFRIRRDGKEIDSKNLYPRLVMARLGESTYRLLELVLPGESWQAPPRGPSAPPGCASR